jgi:hypothetical protein
MGLLKTGACFTTELEANCPTIVDCVVALPASGFATPGTLLLGKDGLFHEVPMPVETPLPCAEVAACVAALPLGPDAIPGTTVLLGNDGTYHLLPAESQALSIAGNVISLTNGGSVTLPTTAVPVPQVLSIAGNTISLSGGGGSVVAPDAQTLSLAGNVLSISNGNNVALPAATIPFATPAETVVGTSTALAVNPADLYARENTPAQTGLGLVLTAIPAPTAGQSPWGTNTAGETLHYAPGLGWKIVDNYIFFSNTIAAAAAVPTAANAVTPIISYTAPRAGRVIIASVINTATPVCNAQSGGITINGSMVAFDNTSAIGPATSASSTQEARGNNASTSWIAQVAAGDVISAFAVTVATAGTAYGSLQVTYVGS